MSKRMSFLFIFIAALTVGCSAENAKPSTEAPSGSNYEIEVLADHLEVPWAIAAAGTRLIFTERPGSIRVISDGELRKEPLFTVPPPFLHEGEGGLLGIVADPAYEENHFLYVYHTYRSDDGTKNRVLRLVVKDNKATIDEVLLDNIPGSINHNGGRLAIGPDGLLYITTGDALEPELSQDKGSLAGKILRINLDGSIPSDNPIPNSPVYSLGHRNPQGLAWLDSHMFISEHGPSTLDEINRIEAGSNYGWPLIKGDEAKQGLISPIIHSGSETWAPSGMTLVKDGEWQGSLLVANLRGSQLLRINFDETVSTIMSIESLYQDKWGRIRDVYEEDGIIYILTNNRDGRGSPQSDDDKIIKLKPIK